MAIVPNKNSNLRNTDKNKEEDKKRISINRGCLTGNDVSDIFDEIEKEIKEIKIYPVNDVSTWQIFKITIEGTEEKISTALDKLKEKDLVFNELANPSSCTFVINGKESGK